MLDFAMCRLAAAVVRCTHSTQVSDSPGAETNLGMPKIVGNIFIGAARNLLALEVVITQDTQPKSVVGVTTEWNNLNRKCSGTLLSVSSFLNTPTFAQARRMR
jgi:hypothetical protein